MPGAEQRTLLRARVLNGAATLIHETSDFRSARPLIEESVAIAREHGDRPLTALVLNNLAWLLVWIGENATAEALCEEALRLNRELENPRGIAIALHNLAWLATFRGDYDRACALHEESLKWRRAHGDLRGAAFAMTDLATAEIKRGALDRASRLLEEARTTLEGLHDRPAVRLDADHPGRAGARRRAACGSVRAVRSEHRAVACGRQPFRARVFAHRRRRGRAGPGRPRASVTRPRRGAAPAASNWHLLRTW